MHRDVAGFLCECSRCSCWLRLHRKVSVRFVLLNIITTRCSPRVRVSFQANTWNSVQVWIFFPLGNRVKHQTFVFFLFGWLPRRLNFLWNRQSVPKRRHVNSEAGESPKRKNTTFRTRRHFEIKNTRYLFVFISNYKLQSLSWAVKNNNFSGDSMSKTQWQVRVIRNLRRILALYLHYQHVLTSVNSATRLPCASEWTWWILTFKNRASYI